MENTWVKFARVALCGLSLVIAGSFGAPRAARADDGMFPPAPAARAAIDFDGQGFLIHGQRTFITSGSLHYPRAPREQWRDIILRFKRAGFNTVQTYVFWNEHEQHEGKWDFTGNRDLGAFLKLVKSLGMYATVRVGPYVCAEWDSGGFPIWMRFKPGLKVRQYEPQYIAAMDKYLDHVLPIVAANQIHRGGAVIMVQLENEHPQGWGREMPNEYFTHFRDKAVAAGIEVPYFFSGLNHGNDPAGDSDWDSVGRSNPWYSTEFWPGWYSDYGPLSPQRLRFFDRGTWKILAYGGNGYNYYMLFGGTNFAYTNNNEDASSYDYSAAVGQTRDLRPIYYKFKRAAWFARSFREILETSHNATAEHAKDVTGTELKVTARASNAGTIVFLDNPTNHAVGAEFGGTAPYAGPAEPLSLEPGEIMGVVRDAKLTPSMTLRFAPVRVLGVAEQGNTTTLVIYGQPNSTANLILTPNGSATVAKGAGDLKKAANGDLVLSTKFAAGSPKEYIVQSGSRMLRILAVDSTLADHTWFVEAGGRNYVVCGPEYVGDATVAKGKLVLDIERPWTAAGALKAVAYGQRVQPYVFGTAPAPVAKYKPAALGNWQMRDAGAPALPNYDDSAWFASDDPQQMGADGDTTAFAWYRAKLTADKEGASALYFTSAKDRVQVYLDGKRVNVTSGKRQVSASLPLTAGTHTVAVFAAHDGRDKMFPHVGTIDTLDPKGLMGPVKIGEPGAGDRTLTEWQWMPVTGAPGATPPAADAAGWTKAKLGQDPFNKKTGYYWYQTRVPAADSAEPQLVHFDDVDDNATIFWNGAKVGEHQGWGQGFDVTLPAGTAGQDGVLTVLVENTSNTGGINGEVTLARAAVGNTVKGWRMKGGPGDAMANEGWKALSAGLTAGSPRFFRTHFAYAAPAAEGPRPVLRAVMTGMTHGFVWLNGHNLGHYPEKVPVDGIYLPECWLNAGDNTLVVFDDEGASPVQASLRVETAASRVAQRLSVVLPAR